jgi:tetratricopeptide (TPR) repeat protein
MKRAKSKTAGRTTATEPQPPSTKPEPAGATAFDSVSPLYLYLSLVALICIVYAQTIGFGYTEFDDTYLVKDNIPILGSIANLPTLMTQDVFLGRGSSVFYRPFQMVSYMLDTVIGRATPAGYHASNLLLHCATTCSILYLLLLLRFPRIPSVFLAAFFAVDPVFVQSVSWIPSRGDLLIGSFGTLAAIFFIRFVADCRIRDLVLHACCLVIAVGSKETAVLVPVVLFAHWWLAGRKGPWVRTLLVPAVFWLSVSAVWFVLRSRVIESGATGTTNLGVEAFIKGLPAIPVLVSKFILPVGLAPMPVFTIAGIVSGVCVIFGLTVWALLSRQIRDPRLLFGALWFIVLVLPALWYRHALGTGAYDYLTQRLYFPAVGLVICLSSLLSDEFLRRRRLWMLISAVVIVACAIDSGVLAGHYSDPLRFYDYALSTNPRSAMAYNNRGSVHRMNGQFQAALADFDAAIRLLPTYPEPHYGRGAVDLERGDAGAAEREFSTAIDMKPDYSDALIGRALARVMKGDSAGAMSDLTAAIRLRPNAAEAYVSRGNLYKTQKAYATAEADYRAALRLQPDMATAYIGLGGIRAEEGKTEEAMQWFSKAVEADPTLAEAYAARGLFKSALNDYPGALADLNEAIRVAPQSLDSYINRGTLYEGMDRLDDALRDFEEVIRKSPKYALAYRNRGVIRYRKDDVNGACADWRRAEELADPGAAALLHEYCK